MSTYQYRNPKLRPDGRIDCEVRFNSPHPRAGEWQPYTASANDPDPRSISRGLHAAGLTDPDLSHELLDPAKILEELARDVRQERDLRLTSTDWTQLPDVPAATRSAFLAYRQALRDLPSRPGFPKTVVWPDLQIA